MNLKNLDVWIPVIGALTALLVGSSVVGVALFARRRDTWPLAGRSFPMLVIIMSLNSVLQITGLVKIVQDGVYPCFVDVTIFMWLFALGVAYFVRCWRLWFEYWSACEKIDHMRAKSQVSMWFARHAHWVREGRLVLLVAAFTALTWFAPVGMFINARYSAGYFEDPPECTELEPINFVMSPTFVLLIMVGIFIAYKLRRVEDGFLIKRELKWVTIFSILLLVLQNVIRFGIEGISEGWLMFTSSLSGLAAVFISLWYPLIMSFLNEREVRRILAKHSKDSQVSKDDVTFARVLSDAECLEAFTEFLKREFSVENIIYYKVVEEFRIQCERAEDAELVSVDDELPDVDERGSTESASDASKAREEKLLSANGNGNAHGDHGEGARGDGENGEPAGDLWSREERNTRAAAIYLDFISSIGCCQVNLASNHVKDIRADLEEVFGEHALEALRKNSLSGGTPGSMFAPPVTSTNPRESQISVQMTGEAPLSTLKSLPSNLSCTGVVSSTLFEPSKKAILRLLEEDSFIRFRRQEDLSELLKRQREREQVSMASPSHAKRATHVFQVLDSQQSVATSEAGTSLGTSMPLAITPITLSALQSTSEASFSSTSPRLESPEGVASI